MNSLSSHVLDTTLGRPASGLRLQLTLPNGNQIDAVTDSDGRCNNWQDSQIVAGTYKLRFDTEEYLRRHHDSAFYPHVDITFSVDSDNEHYHIPLLISPFGFSSYRGS